MPPRSSLHLQHNGIALVSVLVAAAIVLGILTIMNASVLGEITGSRDTRVRNELVQAADGASELARIKLIADFQASGMSADTFIQGLSNTSHVLASPGNGIQAAWAVKRTSSPGDNYGWVDIHTTASRNTESQTVIRRIGFGQSELWKLAMLSENTNCIYCHLHVNGDVGSMVHMRPGWGTEGELASTGSGGGSVINGDLFASTLTADDTDLSGSPKKINGALFSGNVQTNYNFQNFGGLLKDGTFPPIRRANALSKAKGTLSGGTKVGVAKGGKLTTLSSNVTTVNGVYDGNLVLIGTAANPIVLDRDIYVSGDVVIKGVVKGRGAIYAGRNMYVAGNVTSSNPPDKPGQGVCAAFTGTDDASINACATANIQARKDELRLAARGNTVIGDYTSQADSDADPLGGSALSAREQQSATYYRAQFNFYTDRYYDTVTGDELTLNPDGKYYNVEGAEVSAAQVITRGDNPSAPKLDAYTYSMRPGSVASNGDFNSWMSDSFYRSNLLGSQNYTYNTWRTNLSKGSGETLSDFYNRAKAELVKSQIPAAQADAIACNLAAGACATTPPANGDLLDAGGNPIGYYDVNSVGNVRIMLDSAPDVTQVTKVDAFMYSNLRLAGKTSQQAMRINGGIIAKEIGILAPGRTRPGFTKGARYDALGTGESHLADCTNPSGAYYIEGADDCSLTVNYDQRLKTGGYGFGLVDGKPGQTIAWHLGDKSSDKVIP